MGTYPVRYEGTRWKVLFGRYEGVERHALNELQRVMQEYVPYVLEIVPAGGGNLGSDHHTAVVGTPADNPVIRELGDKGLISLPTHSQGYTLACLVHPQDAQKRIVVIAGHDDPGVLYGVEEFIDHLRVSNGQDDPPNKRKFLDELGPFAVSDYPRIENRGIWTWGYVIYDYRRFIDNMVRLRMNMLTIWNDCPPINMSDVIDYAHARGIKVILGFHWGWGIDNLDPSDKATLTKIKDEVVRNYRDEYAHLGMDGIYFQTFTERNTTEINGEPIAKLVCNWVNEIARDLYAIAPDLYIQFGLHATSILDNYVHLKDLDPRMTIVWEDAGVMPYAYGPDLTYGDNLTHAHAKGLNSVDATIAYSRKLVNFRSNTEFGMVPKGFICLRWASEFEHHGPFILGEHDPEFIRRRFEERRARWDYVDALWLRNYPAATRFYREILSEKPSKMTVTALVEDGLFEQTIPMCVSLYAQTLWNPLRDDQEILRSALIPRGKSNNT